MLKPLLPSVYCVKPSLTVPCKSGYCPVGPFLIISQGSDHCHVSLSQLFSPQRPPFKDLAVCDYNNRKGKEKYISK